MTLTLDLDTDRRVRTFTCSDCGHDYFEVTGFVYDDEGAYAIYKARCMHHPEVEAWIDVIFAGDWDSEDGEDLERVTFGCRWGMVPTQSTPVCSLVPAADQYDDGPVYGRKLDRDQALAHPWLSEFWRVVDLILLEDPTVFGFTVSAFSDTVDVVEPDIGADAANDNRTT